MRRDHEDSAGSDQKVEADVHLPWVWISVCAGQSCTQALVQGWGPDPSDPMSDFGYGHGYSAPPPSADDGVKPWPIGGDVALQGIQSQDSLNDALQDDRGPVSIPSTDSNGPDLSSQLDNSDQPDISSQLTLPSESEADSYSWLDSFFGGAGEGGTGSLAQLGETLLEQE